MTTSNVPVRLVYSYCHDDKEEMHHMKTALAPLRDQGVLQEWLDEDIPPGKPITASVTKKLREADIVVFLFSSRFIASSACMEEWSFVKDLVEAGSALIRVPVLLAPCAWNHVLGDEDIKLLPTDARPVAEHDVSDRAWQDVYAGIQASVSHVRETFAPKADFLGGMERTDLLSHEGIKLSQIFVLPPLTSYETQPHPKVPVLERRIPSIDDLLTRGNMLIHGPEMSGKTALARQLFIHLSHRGEGALFVDLKASHGAPNDRTFKTLYEQQFSGDYELWRRRDRRTAIIDNVDSTPRAKKFIAALKARFDRVVVVVPTDTYIAYYRDDRSLVDFAVIRMGQLTSVQQERLIRTRLRLTAKEHAEVTDGTVDQVERQVDNVIYRRIVPRYPFYVLSIIQTFEGYMPSNLSITSYGHCYHALIVARLIKAGVDRRDEDLNACFNFAEHLAFALYEAGGIGETANGPPSFDFDAFIRTYRHTYLIRTSLLSRLRHDEYGIISDRGMFKIAYMYYYFLGKYLASSSGEAEVHVVERMCDRIYVRSNHLTLLFVIHHATDNRVIDAIVNLTSKTIEDVEPASLSTDETRRFNEIIRGLPKTVLNDGDVDAARQREREARDNEDVVGGEAVDASAEVDDQEDRVEEVNDVFRMLKNNEILGQVLRSRYGRLTRRHVSAIIETISDGGLRLVNYILRDEREIQEIAKLLSDRVSGKANFERIVRLVQLASFLWTMTNVEAIVRCVNGANISEVLKEVVASRKTPAYELIAYFSDLDGSRQLDDEIKKRLRTLLREHKDPFVRTVLSLRTQHYMNTHRSDRAVEQGVCQLLGIPPREFLLRQQRSDAGRQSRPVAGRAK